MRFGKSPFNPQKLTVHYRLGYRHSSYVACGTKYNHNVNTFSRNGPSRRVTCKRCLKIIAARDSARK